MSASSDRSEFVAFTKSDEFSMPGYTKQSLPYQRVVALWHNDGFFGKHIGERNTRGRDERTLLVSREIGSRLMSVYSAILEGQEVNCHRFSREISGMDSRTEEPIVEFNKLPVARQLAEGSMGIVGVEGLGVPHSIGYGMGHESLQVMSSGGELGFADNDDVVEFYRCLYKYRIVNLHQA